MAKFLDETGLAHVLANIKNDSNTTTIAKLKRILPITLLANAWTEILTTDGTGTGVYTQTILSDNIVADDNPILISMLPDTATAEEQVLYMNSYEIISKGSATTTDGGVTFKIYNEINTDITVGLKGV